MLLSLKYVKLKYVILLFQALVLGWNIALYFRLHFYVAFWEKKKKYLIGIQLFFFCCYRQSITIHLIAKGIGSKKSANYCQSYPCASGWYGEFNFNSLSHYFQHIHCKLWGLCASILGITCQILECWIFWKGITLVVVCCYLEYFEGSFYYRKYILK